MIYFMNISSWIIKRFENNEFGLFIAYIVIIIIYLLMSLLLFSKQSYSKYSVEMERLEKKENDLKHYNENGSLKVLIAKEIIRSKISKTQENIDKFSSQFFLFSFTLLVMVLGLIMQYFSYNYNLTNYFYIGLYIIAGFTYTIIDKNFLYNNFFEIIKHYWNKVYDKINIKNISYKSLLLLASYLVIYLGLGNFFISILISLIIAIFIKI